MMEKIRIKREAEEAPRVVSYVLRKVKPFLNLRMTEPSVPPTSGLHDAT